MEWAAIIVVAVVVWWLLVRRQLKNEKAAEDRAEVGRVRLADDSRLYHYIKVGVAEYEARALKGDFWKATDGQLLFETPVLKAYHVDHFAETRTGFYFKTIGEYGMYGFFAGNGDDFVECYYRTDSTFQKDEMLSVDDD